MGGWRNIGDKKDVLEVTYAKDFENLDWSNTNLNIPDSKYGWLDRNGKFYGCQYKSHDSCAFYIIKEDVYELELKG